MQKPRNIVVALAMLAAGTVVGVATQHSASADVSSGDRPVLIQISPCRLADTRPAPNNVGPRLGPLGAAETVNFDVQNPTTDCAGKIPTDAVGISTNITALGATQLSFLTIWPSGPQPLAASLNPAPGEPPTPNAVTTGIDGGTFNIFNASGTTDVVIDVNGYYANHTHDDLYGSGGPGSATAGTWSVGAAAFQPWHTNINMEAATGNGNAEGGAWITSVGPPASGSSSQPGLVAPIQLPDGATVTAVTAHFTDSSSSQLNFQLRRECFNDDVSFVANGSSTADPSSGVTSLTINTAAATVDNGACAYFVIAESGSWGSEQDDLKIRGFSVVTE